MIRRFLAIGLLTGVLASAACAPTTRFEWGAYEQALYSYSLSPENGPVYREALERAIEDGRARNAVAPGLLAELGYIHLQAGNTADAVRYFREEQALFPESTQFMNHIISQIGGSDTAAGWREP